MQRAYQCVTDNDYTIEGWPAEKVSAQAALMKMRETHRVNVLATFDMAGLPIRPSFYAQRLKGCDARLTFNFSHWPFNTNGRRISDTIVCDLQQIQVLGAAKAKNSPKRQRNWQRDVFTPLGSPSPKRVHK